MSTVTLPIFPTIEFTVAGFSFFKNMLQNFLVAKINIAEEIRNVEA
jgi:hypothetical protein